MNDLPSFKNLVYLVNLHQELNFHRAAKACGVSQSTLSTGIKNLEDMLGDKLLERHGNTFTFTAIGEDVVQRSRKLLAEANDMVSLVRQQGNVMTGNVRLGCISSIALFVLKSIFKHCDEAYPDLNLTIREDSTSELIDALTKGELDMIFVAQPVDIGNHHYMKVGIDPFKFVVHPDLAERLGEPLNYQDLPDDSIYLLRGESSMSETELGAFFLDNKKKISHQSATSLQTLALLVDAKVGATFLPQMAIDYGLVKSSHAIVMQPPGEAPYREIGLMWRKSSIKVATLRTLGLAIQKLRYG